MAQQCPIDEAQVGAKQARLTAFFVLFASVVFLAAPLPVIALALAFDFALRAFPGTYPSPLALAAKKLLARLAAKEVMIAAAPKRFAARLGLLFSLLALALAAADEMAASRLVAGMLAICAALEALFGFCLGCELYSLWARLIRRDR